MSHSTPSAVPWSSRIAAAGEGWLPYVALGSAALLFFVAGELPGTDEAETGLRPVVAVQAGVAPAPVQPAASAPAAAR